MLFGASSCSVTWGRRRQAEPHDDGLAEVYIRSRGFVNRLNITRLVVRAEQELLVLRSSQAPSMTSMTDYRSVSAKTSEDQAFAGKALWLVHGMWGANVSQGV